MRERERAYSIHGNVIGRDDMNGGHQATGVAEEVSPTLTKSDRHAVCYTVYDTTQITSPVNGSNPKTGGVSRTNERWACAATGNNE